MRRDDPGPYALDTLVALGAPAIFTTDAQVLKARIVAWFEEASGRTLYPMQVEMLLIESLAYAMSVMGEEGQAAIEASLVALADGTHLDAKGPNRSTQRLPAAKAVTTLRFTLAATRSINVSIPAGTVALAGSQRFVTTAIALIRAGQLTADVPAEAEIAGSAGNGFGIGQVNALETPLTDISVANTTISEGGAESESHDLYRLRLANAFDRVSSGGGYGWYRETAMGASSALIDCGVVRPNPCYVDLYPLTTTGAAGTDLRAVVAAEFETERALENRFGDLVTVKAAVAVAKSPVLTIHARGGSTTLAAIARDEALELLTEWGQRLGATIAPHDVEAKVRVLHGVVNAAITGLDFEQLGEDEFLVITSLTITMVWVA